MIDHRFDAELNSFSGRTIDVPTLFIGGARDWGVYQLPGAFEGMQHGVCKRLLGVHLIQGAGHWMAEEQPQQVNQLLIDFLHRAAAVPSRTYARPGSDVRIGAVGAGAAAECASDV